GEGRGRQRRRGSSRSDLPSDLAGLERRRAGLYDLISQVGDFRRGALNAVQARSGASEGRAGGRRPPAVPGSGRGDRGQRGDLRVTAGLARSADGTPTAGGGKDDML